MLDDILAKVQVSPVGAALATPPPGVALATPAPPGVALATPEENRENLNQICNMVGTYAVLYNMDFEVFEDEEIVDLKKAIMDYKIDFAVCDPIYTRIIEEAIAFHEAKGKGKGKGTDSGMEEGG
jgi:hypothetical protein